jgi:hypothetical protein
MCMNIKDVIKNIFLGSKFKHGIYLCTKVEIDDQIMTIYVNVNGRNITVDTDPLLSTTDDIYIYNILYNELKNKLKGFKINIKTRRTKQKNESNDTDDNEIPTLTEKTKVKTKKRGRKKKSKHKSE